MSTNRHIAKPYAKALYELGVSSDTLQGWEAALDFLVACITDKQVQILLKDPAISDMRIAEFIVDTFAKQLPEQSYKNFVRLLGNNKRLSTIPAIKDEFVELCNQANNSMAGTLITSDKVSGAYIDIMRKALAKRFNADIILNHEVDETLLGGAMVRIGDTVIDGSIRNQLERMKSNLLA